jgi:hypothetical protein
VFSKQEFRDVERAGRARGGSDSLISVTVGAISSQGQDFEDSKP